MQIKYLERDFFSIDPELLRNLEQMPKLQFVGVSLANISTNGIFHKFNLLVGDIEKGKICFQVPERLRSS